MKRTFPFHALTFIRNRSRSVFSIRVVSLSPGAVGYLYEYPACTGVDAGLRPVPGGKKLGRDRRLMAELPIVHRRSFPRGHWAGGVWRSLSSGPAMENTPSLTSAGRRSWRRSADSLMTLTHTRPVTLMISD